jgi:hypothetical protein
VQQSENQIVSLVETLGIFDVPVLLDLGTALQEVLE